MHEERDHVDGESRRPLLAGGGDVREREGEHRQAGRARRHDPLEKAAWRGERRREPVEQVREENEELEVASLREVLDRAVRVRGREPANGDEQRDREECEREPPGSADPPRPPQTGRNHGQHDEAD